MKRGISLIVLIITIIVMIIIAGAIIVTISQTNIMTKTTEATTASNLASAKAIVMMKFSNDMLASGANGVTIKTSGAVEANGEYESADAYKTILESLLTTSGLTATNYIVTVTGTPDGTTTGSKITAVTVVAAP